MAQTTFSGPLASGDKEAGISGGPNIGLAVLAQTVTINRDATLVQNGTINLPAGAQIVEIYADVTTAYDSATSATLSVGTASGGTQYASSVNAKTGGRNQATPSAAQAAAMLNIGTNTQVVATVTSVGQPTVGAVAVTIKYVQKP